MPAFNHVLKSLKNELEKQDYLQMYQRTMSNTVLDELSVYVAYRDNSKRLGFTFKDLDKYTPTWVIAKHRLIYGDKE